MRLSHTLPVIVGRIGAPYGLKGWVKLSSFTDPPDALFAYNCWLIHIRNDWQPYQVLQYQLSGKRFIAKLKPISDIQTQEHLQSRESATLLTHADIAISRDQLPPLEETSYYWCDLEGLSVKHSDGSCLGKVDHLMSTGANDVFVVKQAGQAPLLIPYTDDAIIKIDLAAGCITVCWERLDAHNATN